MGSDQGIDLRWQDSARQSTTKPVKLREIQVDPAGRDQLTFNANFSACQLIRFVNIVKGGMKTVLLKSLGPKQTINLFSDPVLAFHIWFVFSFFFC